MDEINFTSTIDDIFAYSRMSLHAIDSDGDSSWPPDDGLIREFSVQSDGLFEVASLRIRTIEMEQDAGRPPITTFEHTLREGRKQSSTHNSVLANEYARILKRAYLIDSTDPMSPRSRSSAIEVYRKVIGSLITLQRPLGIKALANLLGMQQRDARAALKPLSAVVSVPADADKAVYLYHASFQEFLLHPIESQDEAITILLFGGPQHGSLAEACLMHMNNILHRNMCQLEKSIPLNSEISDLQERLVQYIPNESRYACLYGVDHLCCVSPMPALQMAFERWLREKFIFWVEALSLLKELNNAHGILSDCQEWYEVNKS